MDEITIVKATTDDVPDIFDVSGKTWLSTYSNIEYNISEQDYSKMDGTKMQKIVQKRQQEILENPGSYRIAKFGDKTVGYAGSRKYTNFNELFAIYVLPEFQGKGIGKKLMNKIWEYLGKDKPIIVQVVGYNKNAINFYQKFGFEFEKSLPDFELVKGKFVPEIQMIYYPK